MSDSLSQTFLAITRNTTDLEWLQGALAPLGQVVSAGGGSLDELLALVDVTFASLVFARFERGMRQEGRQRIGLGRVGQRPRFFLQEAGRGVDQFVKVFQALAPLFLGKVMLAQSAFLDQVVDDFWQRQVCRLPAQRLDQPDETSNRCAGFS